MEKGKKGKKKKAGDRKDTNKVWLKSRRRVRRSVLDR